jgi:hypothetical protein
MNSNTLGQRIAKEIIQQPSRIKNAARIIIDSDVLTGYIWVKVIREFQSAVSHLYYYIGDLVSKAPWFGLHKWSWRVYQFCMEESVRLDVDCKIWKAVEPKGVTKARRRNKRKSLKIKN